MKVDLFDFDLPEDRIATRPVTPRDAARLLVVNPPSSRGAKGDAAIHIEPPHGLPRPASALPRSPRNDEYQDRVIRDLPELLKPNDLLVLNNTKVIPARLLGRRGEAKVEVTLHKRVESRESGVEDSDQSPSPLRERAGERVQIWQAFAKPAKKLRVGDLFTIAEDFTATVEEKLETGEVVLAFAETEAGFLQKLERYGTMPLPPYMKRAAEAEDAQNYQTMFATAEGAVAAPTAGLHFTPELMAALRAKGMETVEVTLHVGAGTFLPVKVEDTEAHQMHSEWIRVTEEQAAAINKARREGRRIVAVGTTALRTLESIADASGVAHAYTGETDIFITPGYTFKCVDVLLTNFHLPRSTLFMLVSAFAGLEEMKAAYQHAIAGGYRFYSYGDACLLERETV